ncbi:hypothetical protein M407DRAFT_33738 [Tulasnella calospora MUT 4182]|uniref:Protein kinase domain-containing protein n=1 Tax=Tulasnella calospora MUT 4182 TaxID=1051891 RepID=A0A0C3Q1T5_9AGAM|nr:hypothetical protein M407DRAFT_33738 [Tulasnella calospora MUT 4182]
MAEQLLYKKVSATKGSWIDSVQKQMEGLEPIAQRIETLLELWPELVDPVLRRSSAAAVKKYRDEKKELGIIAKFPLRSQKVAEHRADLETQRFELSRRISEARVAKKAAGEERQRAENEFKERYMEDAKNHRATLFGAVGVLEYSIGFGQFVMQNKTSTGHLFATIDRDKSTLFIDCNGASGGKKAQGSFGSIYSASTPDGETYAVKLPGSGRLCNNELEREGEIWDALQKPERHPNILQFHGTCSVGGRMFKGLLSRWVAGGLSWKESLRSWSEGQNIEFIERIASALVHMHAKAIIHGDIKLDNVVISPTPPQPLLCDFGLSVRRLLDSTRDSVKGTGSGPHLSPQVYKGLPKTAGSDTWAFGISILHALSQTVPFEDRLANVPLEQVPEEYFKLFVKSNLRPNMPANLGPAGVLTCMEETHRAMQDILNGRDGEVIARLEKWKADADPVGQEQPEREID